ncbi:MAG TPA: prolipoprotein diacylglyceryl transferase [Rhodobacteraceae bacterium]|nr:prolipoprotein diacylglyceryl transferase [Paracoccaceae bacterium]
MENGIPFPDISPEIFSVNVFGMELALRWYALGYIVGIVIGWWIIRRAIATARLWRDGRAPMNRTQLEDLLTWIVLGVIIGGRLGFVLFYQPAYYFANPLQIPQIWTGGMSFHGGFIGVIVAVWLFPRRHGLPTAQVADLMAIAAPAAIFLVRIANFINNELWGKPSTLPWAVIFPGPAAQNCPGYPSPCARHPSQLYEALLEGALLGTVLLVLAWKRGWLKRPGLLTGSFFLGYGLARYFVEFFRQADAQFISPDNPMGYTLRIGAWGVSQGQLLSLPMIAVGIAVLVWASRRAAPGPGNDTA